MIKKFADLTLYMGLCSSVGIGEFSFHGRKLETMGKWEKDRYIAYVQYARKVVDYNVNKKDGDYSHSLEYGWTNFVKDGEKEARKIIEWILENVPNSEERIEVIDQQHGKLRFYRKIRFFGITEKNKQELIDKINSSGMGPGSYDYKTYETRKAEYYWSRFLKFDGSS